MDAEDEKLARLFLPHVWQAVDKVRDQKGRFVHYTSAQNAMSIIAGRCVWLRNTMFMNDYSEISYGIDRVIEFFRSKDAESFWNLIREITRKDTDEIKALFDGWAFDLRTQTYVMCVSEHDADEDVHGRLSMWRGYGTSAGVALVIKPDAMMSESDALQAYSYPVVYRDGTDLTEMFRSMMDGIASDANSLKSADPQNIFNYVFLMLYSLPICLKHPGFKEEREWRIVYQPTFNKSTVLIERIQSISGFPQKIYELPLRNIPDHGLLTLDPEQLIDRVIIGPTEHGLAMYHAFVDLLRAAGVSKPEEKVFRSDIPFRV